MSNENKISAKQKLSNKEELLVTLRVKQDIVKLIDKERSKFNAPRGSWITQVVVEKLERLGYEIK